MKKTLIRHNVWETNSSSSHSLSIADATKEFVLDTIYPDQDGVVTVKGGEFGWEWAKYNDADTKATYAAQQFAYSSNKLDMLRQVIMEQTGADKVVFVGLEDGYVDHQSEGLLDDADEEKLRSFIFNKNSWAFTGNDNSSADPTFYHVPEFKDGKKILPKYKYELKIEGFNKTTKFLDEPTKDELDKAFKALLDGYQVTDDLYYFNRRENFGFDLRGSGYEISYKRNLIDQENKTISLVKDAYNAARKLWEKDYGTNDWSSELGYKKCREIEDGLYNAENSEYIKKVKYELVEL